VRTLEVQGELRDQVRTALGKSPWFRALKPEALEQVVAVAALHQYEADETIVQVGEPSDAFFLVLKGVAAVQVGKPQGELVEVGRLQSPASFGEIGLLLEEPRTATVTAVDEVVVARFAKASFSVMFEKVPGFGLSATRGLAERVHRLSGLVPLPEPEPEDRQPSADALSLLPVSFLQRHRVLPLRVEENVLVLGFVDDPGTEVLSGARQHVPGMELRPVRIDAKTFNDVMSSKAGIEDWKATPTREAAGLPPAAASSPRLDQLLERAVAEGASDLHLSAGHKPHWRIDGDMRQIDDAAVLGEEEVRELLEPVMDERHRRAFAETHDTDFAYAVPGAARFRVNLFRDSKGAGAVLRQIPSKVLSIEQLAFPKVLTSFCDYPKGLVLVTGPTGCGKSTTLAAMVDYINRTWRRHIITLEDPIEFVYESQRCLVNQREVGGHTQSYARALKAALREDPDIVLVGEMRDLETIALAVETANTGHLVLGTLHTSSAVMTVDRIVDMYPSDEQPKVRTMLSDALKGVVCQTLCKKRGGGRIAALEILVVNSAVENLVREGKTIQIPNVMQSSKALGNQMMNDDLTRLVEKRQITYEEALSRAVEKADLARRCGKTA